jgi:hypothetical protein
MCVRLTRDPCEGGLDRTEEGVAEPRPLQVAPGVGLGDIGLG